MELVGPSKRKYAGVVIQIFWCIGIFLQTGLAFGTREWRHLQMSISAGTVLLFSYWWLVPESPRWLINKGRLEEASDVIKKAAKVNKVTLSEKVSSLQEIELDGQGEKIWHMFTTPTLIIRSGIIFFNWLVASMTYYGLSLNVGSLSGDIFVNNALSATVELSSYIFCILALDVVGRKRLQIFSNLLGGVACVCTMFPVIFGGPKWINVVLALVGRFGASAAFAVIYIYSAELFPTVMRNSGMGVSSVCARIGGILAPFVGDLGSVLEGDIAVALPLIVFGGLCVTAGLLDLLLPETLNRKLPDTVEDAKNFGRKSSKNLYELEQIGASGKKEKMSNGHINPTFTDIDLNE